MKDFIQILPSSCWFSKLPKYLETKSSGEKVHSSMLKMQPNFNLNILFAQGKGDENSHISSF
jgi:hypothetical protein